MRLPSLRNRPFVALVLLLTAGLWLSSGVRCGDTFYFGPPTSERLTR